MRHRRKGRHLGRSSPHRKAMFRNLAASLFLSERDDDIDEAGYEYPEWSGYVPNRPKMKGRVITTVPKAKAVRPYIERVITIARRALVHEEAARQYATDAPRGSDAWRAWRESEKYRQWQNAMGPAVTARRRCVQLLGSKLAVQVLFETVAPRFADRNGGYTRIMRLADPRLGDAGARAILEFVGVRDRVARRAAPAPAPAIESPETESPESAKPVESAAE